MKIERTKVEIESTKCKYCQGACDGLFCNCVRRLDKYVYLQRGGKRREAGPRRRGAGLSLFFTRRTREDDELRIRRVVGCGSK